MKKKLYFIVLPCILWQSLPAQQPLVQKIKAPVKNNRLSAGPAFPMGRFAPTHFPGITMNYMRVISKPGNKPVLKSRKTGLILGSSLYHFWGKKEMPGGSLFRYPAYSALDLRGGMNWTPPGRVSC